MNFFWSYVLILLGCAAFTVGALGRFVHRGKLRFELDDLWRLLVIIASVAMLVGGIILYSYQAELAGYWSKLPLLPTPTR